MIWPIFLNTFFNHFFLGNPKTTVPHHQAHETTKRRRGVEGPNSLDAKNTEALTNSETTRVCPWHQLLSLCCMRPDGEEPEPLLAIKISKQVKLCKGRPHPADENLHRRMI